MQQGTVIMRPALVMAVGINDIMKAAMSIAEFMK